VDGKKLERPVHVLIRCLGYPYSITLPAEERCVFKGYESGEMIGVPPAVPKAYEELGRTDVPMSPTFWRWRPYFVALVVVEPKGLELPKIKAKNLSKNSGQHPGCCGAAGVLGGSRIGSNLNWP
jgi:hypothetical protein